MVKLVDKQNIFNAGIVSTKLHSRDDLKHFNNGIADANNFICSRYGPMEKRVGTQFIWDLDTYGQESFFLPFVFSIKQSLLLEFLANKIRFYAFDPGEGIQFAPIADPGHTWISSTGGKVYSVSDNVEVDETVYSDEDMTISAGTVDHVGEGAVSDAVTLHDVTDTDGIISGFDSDSYLTVDGGEKQGIVTKIHTGSTVGEGVFSLLEDGDAYNMFEQENVRKYYKYQYSTFTRPNLSAAGEMGGNSFAVSANSHVSSYQVYKAVDGNNSTGWEVSSPTTAYYIFYNPIPLKLTSIKMRNWAGSGNIDASKGGKVYGANDGDTWTELVTYTNTSYSSGAEWNIDMSSVSDAYNYYKITCTDGTSNGRSYWNVAEITPFGSEQTVVAGTSSDYDFYRDETVYSVYTFSGRKTVLTVTPSGNFTVSNTYTGPEASVGVTEETLTCTHTYETPEPIALVTASSGSTDFGTGHWDWTWGESGAWLGGSLGSGYTGYVFYQGRNCGWSSFAVHPSQSYTFSTPLPAGKYTFQCCSNGVGSGYRLFYTSGGVEYEVTLPTLSTSEWSLIGPIVVEDTITSVRAQVISQEGRQGIGSVHILSEPTWENSSQEEVTLAEYNLNLETGNPAVGDTIGLTYTTTQLLEADTDYYVKALRDGSNCQVSISEIDDETLFTPVATVYNLSDLFLKTGSSFAGTLNLRQSYLQLNRGVSFLGYDSDFININGTDYVRKEVQYEIPTPFTAQQIKGLNYVQSLDVLYLAFFDGQTQPYTLSRYASNHWKLKVFEAEDGPYLDQNYSTNKKVAISDKLTTTSTVTLTGFTLGSADIGRWIRINTPRYNENTYAYEDKWSYGKIKTVASGGASITVDWTYRNIVDETDQGWMTDATSEWRLGVWHTGTGNSDYPVTYPTKVCIHQQRLVWAGTTDKPWLWMSNSFAYNNYAPSDYEGEITDANAIYQDMSTDKISEIFWIESMKSLLVGTELGEIRVHSAGTAITPSDVVASRESSYGSYNEKPIVTDDMIVFIQRLQRTIRSLTYDHNYDSYTGPELTLLVESLTTGGIKKIVYQKEPNNTIWCIKEDGSLLTLTYDKVQEVIGWSKSTLAGGAKVIDLAVLPSDDYLQDMVFFVVERNINGDNVRYLELLTKNFTDDVQQKDAWFLDCATRCTSESPFTTIDGLEYIEGQNVRVMTEGRYYGDFVVKDGMVTLHDFVTDALVGLPYEATFETLERDFGDKQISTKMSKLRIYKMRLYLVRTLGLLVNRLQKGDLTMLKIYDTTDKRKLTSDYVTGKIDIEVQTAWDCDYRLRFQSEAGLPCTVSGIIAGVEINEL